MSNNLKRMEKDLRTLAKRCKDIKYTRALLLSFLLITYGNAISCGSNIYRSKKY